MDQNNEQLSTSEKESTNVQESPKPLAFTIDFDDGKTVDTQRHKILVEKYQKKHKRGKSLSKLDNSPSPVQMKKHPLTGNLPRKSSFQSEGYFSSDEKSDIARNVRPGNIKLRGELTLPLKNAISEKMTQSFPNCNLPSISSPEIELKDISSPEMELISPFSPTNKVEQKNTAPTTSKITKQHSSAEGDTESFANEKFIDGAEFDFDKSDTVSDAGTYTIETDYSEEQKARMSIDQEFKIEEVSVLKKTQDYVQSLNSQKGKPPRSLSANSRRNKPETIQKVQPLKQQTKSPVLSNSQSSPTSPTNTNISYFKDHSRRMLSPILSPTQNMSITHMTNSPKHMNNDNEDIHNKTFTKIMFPSPKAKNQVGLEQLFDQGAVISVTSSGAFRSKNENQKGHVRQLSLTKSEIHVEAYTGDRGESIVHAACTRPKPVNLSANIVNVQSIQARPVGINNTGKNNDTSDANLVYDNLVFEKVSNLPPAMGSASGKSSPSKIPSPVHSASRPRSRNSASSLNFDFSDSSLETESYLRPTQNYIKTLERRLPLDSDQESDYDNKYNNIPLNNDTRNLLKQKLTHARHNSFDDRNLKLLNKLEHFQNKNLQAIDQTPKVMNQYPQNKVVHKIQNSPNNSPIKRSSSFSNKNHINTKNTNIQKETNLRSSPNLTRNSSIQRSASTASIKPMLHHFRRSSVTSEHKIDRSQFGDTESSSEDDFERNFQKKKDLANITNTKCNRAFTLRRARLDAEPAKCPNTPEMRRKFQSDQRPERAISVDRKTVKTNEVQSRYLLNLSKKNVTPKPEIPKNVPKSGSKAAPIKQGFTRTDTGRFSMRAALKSVSITPKNTKKEGKYFFKFRSTYAGLLRVFTVLQLAHIKKYIDYLKS